MEIVPIIEETQDEESDSNGDQIKSTTKNLIEVHDEKEKGSTSYYKKADLYKNTYLQNLNDEQKRQLYQILALITVLEKPNHLKFYVPSDLKLAGKLDDIVLTHPINNHQKHHTDILFQAKYKPDSGIQNFEELFDLKEYFNSYYLKGEILHFVFCTNLKVSDNKKDGIVEIKSGSHSIYLHEILEEDSVFSNFERQFRFDRKVGSNEKYLEYLRSSLNLTGQESVENLGKFMQKVTFIFDFDFGNAYEVLKEDFELDSAEVCPKLVEPTFLKWIESIPTRRFFTYEKYKILYNQILNEVFKTKIHQKSRTIYEAENQYKLNSLNYELMEFLTSESSASKVCYVKTEPDESFCIAAKTFATLKKKLNDSSFLVVQTSWEDKLFQKVIDETLSDPSLKLLVIENDSGKNLILVESKFTLLRDQKIVIVHHGFTTSRYNIDAKKVTHERIDIGRLDGSSLKKISNQKVNFQGNEVRLEELIDLANRETLSSILLTNISHLKSLSKSYSCDQDFYIQKDLVCNRFVDWKILKANFDQDLITLNQEHFAEMCEKSPTKNIHLLGRESDQLKWLKSRGDLTKFRQFIKDGKEVIKEEELLEDSEKVFILADSAGSGKTIFLQQISKKLNQKFHNEWIIFVDLNRHRSEITEKSFENHERFKEFLRKDVLGLKNNLEEIIFNHALEDCKGKNVNILLDGFGGSVREKQLIQITMDIGFKRLFITTRPEFGETLEDLTTSLRMKFVAFDRNDQEQLLSNLLKDPVENETECKKLVSKVVSKIEEIQKAHYHIVGTPLIVKMLAEILSSFEDDEKRLDEVVKINLNIYQLYQKYFDVKMRAYYKRDIRHLTSSFESFETELLPILENLAVQQIFPELKRHTTEKTAIKDDGIFYLSTAGFIQQIKQRTLAEFLVVDNLTDITLTDSMWEKLFHDPEFSTIRSFLASWMAAPETEMKYHQIYEKILNDCKSYPNILSTTLIEDRNVRDFEVYLKTLQKIGGKSHEEELIQILIKKIDENSNNCSIISYYFKNYEVDSEILDKLLIGKLIDQKFSYNDFNDYNLLMISPGNFHNIFAILKLSKTHFKNEDKILHDFLTYQEPRTKKDFLQILIENSTNDQEKVMHVIEKLHEIDGEILKEIFMQRDSENNTIFHLLILKQAPIEHFTKVLFWVDKVCGLQVFEELLLEPSIFNTDWLIVKKVPLDYLVHIIPDIIEFLNKIFSQKKEVKPFEISKKMAGKLLQGSYKEIDFEFHEIFFKLEIVKKLESNTKFFNEEIERIFLASYLNQSEDLFKEKPEKFLIPALKKILATEFSFQKSGVFLKMWEKAFEDKGFSNKFTTYIMKNDKDEILNLLEKRELFDILLIVFNETVKSSHDKEVFDKILTKKLPIVAKKFLDNAEPSYDLLLKLFDTIKEHRGDESLKSILLTKGKFEENLEMNLLEVLFQQPEFRSKIENFLLETFKNDEKALDEISIWKSKSDEVFLSK
jgi:hypothetical protein